MIRFTPSRILFALLVVALVIMLQAPDAFAIGDDISTSNFTCSGSTASGTLFVAGDSCPTALTKDNLFSFLVCNFEQLSSNVMGVMYCGMVQTLASSVYAAITLAVVIYGIMFMMGMIPATGQEALKFITKCAFVALFTTNADYLIGVAYRGALGAISAGSSIAISLMSSDATSSGPAISSGADVYSELDGFLSTLFHYATDYINKPGTLDYTAMCKNALFAVLGTMFVVFPLFAYMGLMLVARILLTFFRAVFAYIYAIVGITFILLLAPFFITFAMFKLTSSLFERWLGYLVSFALQVVLLFSFLAFIFSMHLERQSVVTNLTSTIMYNAEQAEGSSFRLPFAYCTLCDFQVVDSTGAVMTDKDPNYISQGKLTCVDHSGDSPAPKDLQTVTIPDPTSTTTPPATKQVQTIPVRPTFATSPNSKGQLGALLSFAGNGILSLIILALIIEHLLQLIPSIAQILASNMNASYATQLGGGTNYVSQGNSVNMPGTSVMNDFKGGFDRGFSTKMDSNGVSAVAEAIKQGGSSVSSGIGGSLGTFLSDPGKFGQ